MQQTIDIDSFIGKHGSDWMDECFEDHRSFEITAILEGFGHFEWQGGRIFVETGSVIMIPSELSHRFAARSPISFGVIQMEAVPVHLSELFNQITGGQQTPKIFALSRLEMEQYERIFREWLRIMSSSLKQKDRNYVAWMEIILLFLLEHDEPGQNALTIIKAADYIRDNLHRPLRISSLAKLSGLSESAFRKLFEHAFQLPPKLYQQKCRLDEAKWLLSSSDREIQNIAEKIGFSRLHSFSQWFKSSVGVCPSEWRKRERQNLSIPSNEF